MSRLLDGTNPGSNSVVYAFCRGASLPGHDYSAILNWRTLIRVVRISSFDHLNDVRPQMPDLFCMGGPGVDTDTYRSPRRF